MSQKVDNSMNLNDIIANNDRNFSIEQDKKNKNNKKIKKKLQIDPM